MPGEGFDFIGHTSNFILACHQRDELRHGANRHIQEIGHQDVLISIVLLDALAIEQGSEIQAKRGQEHHLSMSSKMR